MQENNISSEKVKKGHMHPISIAINDISKIFTSLGFDVNEGPELEDEWHNFDALNVGPHHPARDMQDTFWIAAPSPSHAPSHKATEAHSGEGVESNKSSHHVLRTHTSNVQIRTMEKVVAEVNKRVTAGESREDVENELYPIAMCSPGKVFRNEATDATHEAQFHQVEGLYIAKDASLAMMIGVMQKFYSDYFGGKPNVRLRSSYFPFVEPGNEVDMECFKCKGSGKDGESNCSVCKGSKWIEIAGAGMVHRNVLIAGGIDPDKYKGFAFGSAVDRLVMLKYGVDDIRLLYDGDLRVVSQF